MTEEQEGLLVENTRKRQRLVNAWARLLATPDGKFVMDDLKDKFGLNKPVFAPVSKGEHFSYDPLTAALTDGARRVLIYIDTLATSPVVGDANHEKPKVKIRKAKS